MVVSAAAVVFGAAVSLLESLPPHAANSNAPADANASAVLRSEMGVTLLLPCSVLAGGSGQFGDTVTKLAPTWHTRRMARPRNQSIDDRIMSAAAELAQGGHPFTIAEVAALAGVSRPTVYRRWPTPAALLFELQTMASVPPAMPDLGSLRAELTLAVQHLVATMVAADRGALSAQMAEMIVRPEFAAAVRERRWNPDREQVHTIWQRAVDRGEAPASGDGRAVIDDLVAICHFRVNLLHQPPSAAECQQLVDRLLFGALDDAAN